MKNNFETNTNKSVTITETFITAKPVLIKDKNGNKKVMIPVTRTTYYPSQEFHVFLDYCEPTYEEFLEVMDSQPWMKDLDTITEGVGYKMMVCDGNNSFIVTHYRNVQ